MLLISGSSNIKLATKIAKILSLELIPIISSKFPDQELRVRFPTSPSLIGKAPLFKTPIAIIQSISPPAQDSLMELLLITNLVKKHNPQSITAVIPYFGYARQDLTTVRFIIQLLASAGINQILTIDLHSRKILEQSCIKIINLTIEKIIAANLNSWALANKLIIAPDHGAITRAKKLATALNTDYLIINKSRQQPMQTVVCNLAKNMEYINIIGKNCIIIDDIIDTGATLNTVSKLLKYHGANSVWAYCTHPIISKLSDPPNRYIDKFPYIDKLATTDTIVIPNGDSILNFSVLSVAELLAQTIISNICC